MAELHGEKIDIVDYSDDPAEFVANALSPARVTRVEVVDRDAMEARVTVPDYQLSLAIGKEGQNARLAARLTGWRIDIRSDGGHRRGPRPAPPRGSRSRGGDGQDGAASLTLPPPSRRSSRPGPRAGNARPRRTAGR